MKLLFLLILLITLSVRAATYSAASTSWQDVTNAWSNAFSVITQADTFYVPAGVAKWTNQILFNKACTVRGAGIGQTVIQDYIAHANGTIIKVYAAGTNTHIRITGFSFERNRGSLATGGTMYLGGNDTVDGTIRVDHCSFSNLYNSPFFAADVIGVIDHCIMMDCVHSFVFHEVWPGYMSPNLNLYGHGSWAEAANWNSTNWLVFEDNFIARTSSHSAGIDGWKGMRVIVRFNTLSNVWIDAHGTESSAPTRGARALQIYNNDMRRDFASISFPAMLDLRGGTALVVSNRSNGSLVPYTRSGVLTAYRLSDDFAVFGGASGTNALDNNYPGGPFASGTHTGANGATTLTDGTKSFTNSFWLGAELQNTTAGRHAEILANTGTTIDYAASGYTTKMAFNTGDSYEIWWVNEVFDQPGKGRGDLMSGNPPSPFIWPNQADEPCFSASNTVDGVLVNFSPVNFTIRAGEHFFDNTLPTNWFPMAYPHWLATNDASAPVTIRLQTSGQIQFIGPVLAP